MSKVETNPSTEPITAKIARLDQEIEWFYGDDFNLDQAIEKYKHAINLSKTIETELNDLKNEVEVLADFTKEKDVA